MTCVLENNPDTINGKGLQKCRLFSWMPAYVRYPQNPSPAKKTMANYISVILSILPGESTARGGARIERDFPS